jgi:hypothetical protein
MADRCIPEKEPQIGHFSLIATSCANSLSTKTVKVKWPQRTQRVQEDGNEQKGTKATLNEALRDCEKLSGGR